MIWTKKVNDELYVYYNGQLIYKRWLKLDYGRVFDLYSSFTSKDIDRKKNNVVT